MQKVLIGNFKGPKGDKGDKGDIGPQGPAGHEGPVDGDSAIAFEVPEEYEAPKSGNAIKVLFGKIAKGLSNLFAAIGVLASLKTVNKSTLVAAINELAEGKLDIAKIVASTNITEPGFLMDGKTASEAFAELYSKNETKKYTDISNLIQAYDSNILNIAAYAENGCIVISIKVNAGTNGVSRFSVLTERYCPRLMTNGVYSSLASIQDTSKFNGAYIDTSGNGTIYLNNSLSYDERVSFVYPIRT